ncbi:MAG: alpha/beta hydrolase, partial [Pseudomonadota bacterium]
PTPTSTPTPTPTPTPTSAGSGQKITLDIEYAQGATSDGSIPLLLDLYEPDEPCTANRPIVLFVHGGGFTSGDKDSGNARFRAEQMNARGFNFVSINYRLDPDNPVPSAPFVAVLDDMLADGFGDPSDPRLDAIAAAFEDTVAALNFLRDNANTYCTDTSRIAYWGSSAGAFTSLQVAYGLDQFGIDRPEPSVVIDYWGALIRPTDLDVAEAPFLVIHGTQDNTVDYQNAVDLTNQAQTVGVSHAFYTVVGAGHGGRATGIDVNEVDGQTLHERTFDFVEAHLTGGTPIYGAFEIAP